MIGTHLFRSGHMQLWVPVGSSCASWRWSSLERWTDSKGQFNIAISGKNPSQKKDSAEASLGKCQIPWNFSFKGHVERVFQRGDAVCSAWSLSSQTVEKGSPDGSSAVLPGRSKLWSLLLQESRTSGRTRQWIWSRIPSRRGTSPTSSTWRCPARLCLFPLPFALNCHTDLHVCFCQTRIFYPGKAAVGRSSKKRWRSICVRAVCTGTASIGASH